MTCAPIYLRECGYGDMSRSGRCSDKPPDPRGGRLYERVAPHAPWIVVSARPARAPAAANVEAAAAALRSARIHRLLARFGARRGRAPAASSITRLLSPDGLNPHVRQCRPQGALSRGREGLRALISGLVLHLVGAHDGADRDLRLRQPEVLRLVSPQWDWPAEAAFDTDMQRTAIPSLTTAARRRPRDRLRSSSRRQQRPSTRSVSRHRGAGRSVAHVIASPAATAEPPPRNGTKGLTLGAPRHLHPRRRHRPRDLGGHAARARGAPASSSSGTSRTPASTSIEEEGTPLPDRVLDSITERGIAIKGPITTPVGSGFRSINVALRKELDLYACLRPCKAYEGVRTRYPETRHRDRAREHTRTSTPASSSRRAQPEQPRSCASSSPRADGHRVREDTGISIKPISVIGTRADRARRRSSTRRSTAARRSRRHTRPTS